MKQVNTATQEKKKLVVHVKNCDKYDQRKRSTVRRSRTPAMQKEESGKSGEKPGKLVPLRV
jgi:hypothetical protein